MEEIRVLTLADKVNMGREALQPGVLQQPADAVRRQAFEKWQCGCQALVFSTQE